MVFKVDGSCTSFSEVQNARKPYQLSAISVSAIAGRDVMPSGMVIFSSEVQVLNTSLPNDVIVWGRSICVRAVQPAKAESPILVTLSGTETPVMAVLPWNALSPIRVTDFPPISAGSSSSPETSAEQPVMVTVPFSSVV